MAALPRAAARAGPRDRRRPPSTDPQLLSRIRLYIAASLDGYIARPDGSVDWLERYPGQEFGYDDFIATVDNVVMGRATYEQTLSFGVWPYPGKRAFVVTSRPVDDERVEATADVPRLIETLRALPGDSWVVGGARLLDAMLPAVDELEIYVIPVLLGDGIRLFGSHAVRELRLLEATTLKAGVVKLRYA